MSGVEPGWYKDPADPTTQRYWDGDGWIGASIPADATPPATPPVVATSTDPPTVSVRSGTDRRVADRRVGDRRTGGDRRGSGDQRAAGGGPAGGGPSSAGPSGAGPSSAEPPGAVPPAELPPGGPATDTLPPLAPPHARPPHPPPLPQPPPRPHGYPLATFGARFAARLIDIVAVLGLNIVVNGWFVVQYFRQVWPYAEALSEQMLANQPLAEVTPPDQVSTLQLTILLLAAASWFAYEVPSTANTGQTLGKRLMRIKVVRVESTDPIGLGRAWRRWNPLGLPTLLWNCCGIGLLLQAADLISGLVDRPLRQAAHDRWAGTVVVAVPPGSTIEPPGVNLDKS